MSEIKTNRGTTVVTVISVLMVLYQILLIPYGNVVAGLAPARTQTSTD